MREWTLVLSVHFDVATGGRKRRGECRNSTDGGSHHAGKTAHLSELDLPRTPTLPLTGCVLQGELASSKMGVVTPIS